MAEGVDRVCGAPIHTGIADGMDERVHAPASASMRLADFTRRLHAARITTTASAAAFWLFLSIFPAGLATVNVLGLIDAQDHVASVVSALAAIFPGNFGRLLGEQLAQVAAVTPGSWWLDCLLVALSLWTISTAIDLLLESVRESHEAPRRERGRGRLVALAGASLTIPVVAEVAYIASAVASAPLRVAVEVLASFAVAATMYRVGSRGRCSWRHALPGAALAAAGFFVALGVLRIYLSVAPNMVAIYGTTSGIVGALLVVWVGAFAVIVGAILNAHLRKP